MDQQRQPTATEVDEFIGLAIVMLLERRPDLVDEVTGLLIDDVYVERVVRGQVVALADERRAWVAA